MGKNNLWKEKKQERRELQTPIILGTREENSWKKARAHIQNCSTQLLQSYEPIPKNTLKPFSITWKLQNLIFLQCPDTWTPQYFMTFLDTPIRSNMIFGKGFTNSIKLQSKLSSELFISAQIYIYLHPYNTNMFAYPIFQRSYI